MNRVQFKKVDIRDLRRRYTVADIHMHSKHSDGINTVKSLVKKARKLKIGIAITDHNEIAGAVELSKYKDLLTIPGIEVTAKEGTHILIYFYDITSIRSFYSRCVKPHMGSDLMSAISLKTEEVIQHARRYPCLIAFPHPYGISFEGICNAHFHEERLHKVLDMVDGVEVINGENLHKWNLKSAVLGFNLGKSMIGGSDGHTLYHMGRVVTAVEGKVDKKGFLDAIKQRENIVVGREIDMLRRITSNGFKLKKSLKNYPDSIEKSVRYAWAKFKRRTFLNNIKMSKR